MRRILVLGTLALLSAGCDSGPDGPGDLTGTVTSQGIALGGVVLEVVGSGIEGFSGAGGTKVFWTQQVDPAVYRIIVISDGNGDMGFTVSVRDRGDKKPKATVVSLVAPNNMPLPVTTDYKVRFTP